jgi:PAS domain S-box-containing protein
MKPLPERSASNLQQSLSLYRQLLSLTRAPKSEQEVIRFVIDRLFTLFPDTRISFSNIWRNGKIHIIYSRQPTRMADLSGREFDLSGHQEILGRYLHMELWNVPDIRKEPILEPVLPILHGFGANLARLDIPFHSDDDRVSLLTFARPEPGEWERPIVEMVVEVGAILNLIFRDIRAQQKLHESEMLFRQFAENIEVVFWMSDLRKKEMVYVSPSYEKIWGRSTDSLYANPLSFLDGIHEEDRERVRKALDHQHLGYEQEYRVVRPDGQESWVKDRGFPVRDENGEIYRIAGIAEDVTQLHEARERLKITQTQVVTNTKFAALGEMASGIAHEINNPLAVIHGLAVQMQERLQTEKAITPVAIEAFASMEKMANRIAGIVKGLRTFSRQTAGDPLLPADLSSILQETMAMCHARLKAANIHLRMSLAEERLVIRCRSSEISQVLLNLINNAYDAVLAAPYRELSISSDVHGKMARLWVEDNGVGIRPDVREKIFQPFFTTKEVGKGTGLGLSISKGIVEAHGGKLFLDQRSDKTRFVIELPLERL